MTGEFLNMLYLVAGLFVALTAVIWRLQAMAQKVQEAKWATNDTRWEEARRADDARWAANEARWAAMEGQVKKVVEGMDTLDDRVRGVEMIMAVIADRLEIVVPVGGFVGGRRESSTAASAAAEAAASSEEGGESSASVPPGYVP